jgi:hypothetical protein
MSTHKFAPDPDHPAYCLCSFHKNHRAHGLEAERDKLIEALTRCRLLGNAHVRKVVDEALGMAKGKA